MTHQKLFFIDGIGALVSVVLLAAVLPYFEAYIGMPRSELYRLAVLPCFYAAYSLTCAIFTPQNSGLWLRGIACANLFYVGLTVVLLLLNRQIIKPWGWLYFFGEAVVIVGLAYVEYRMSWKRSVSG
jgi:hypothetical protein